MPNKNDLSYFEQEASPKSIQVPESKTNLFSNPENSFNLRDFPEHWTILHDISLIKIHFTPKYPAQKSVKEKFVFYFDVPTIDLKFRGKELGKKYRKEENQKFLFDEVARELAKADSVEESQMMVERSHQRLVEFFKNGELASKTWKKILSEIVAMNSISDFFSPEQKAKLRELLSFWTEQGLDLCQELKILDGPTKSMGFWKQLDQRF